MEIFLVRHTAVDVPAGISYGQTDVPLKGSFPEEAKAVRKQLKNLTFDCIYTSPLLRCVRLAKACGFTDVRHDDRLKELNFGDWEMMSWDEIALDPYSQLWFDDWINVPTKNGESFQQQYNRVASFLDDMKNSGLHRICAFAHGGILTCARVYTGEYNLKEAFKHVPPYGSVISIVL